MALTGIRRRVVIVVLEHLSDCNKHCYLTTAMRTICTIVLLTMIPAAILSLVTFLHFDAWREPLGDLCWAPLAFSTAT